MKVLLSGRLRYGFFEVRMFFIPSERVLINRIYSDNLEVVCEQFKRGTSTTKWVKEHPKDFLLIKEIEL